MTTGRQLVDDCFLHDGDRLKHGEVIALLRERLVPTAGVSDVRIEEAGGRVLAESVTAPRNVPAHTNAAVDGYAVRHSDLDASGPTTLPVPLRIAAGDTSGAVLPARASARIFTGARLPDGADTVLMQEDCEVVDAGVCVPPGAKPGANVRMEGEDFARGAVVAEAGRRLRPQDLAAVAATGAAEVRCRTPLSVGLLSTGDEVLQPGEAFVAGQVYDSNRFLLRALLAGSGVEVTDLGILADDRDAVRDTVLRAAGRHDVVITTGGASRGEEDHVVDVISSEGSLHAWQLAVKPGRPLAFGQIGDTVFLGLPGNPVAAFVCHLFYAQPMLALLQGAEWSPPRRYAFPAGFAVEGKKPGRREFWRAWIEDGRARKFERDGSGLISGLTAAQGIIDVAEEVTSVSEGDMVDYIPFTEFGFGN